MKKFQGNFDTLVVFSDMALSLVHNLDVHEHESLKQLLVIYLRERQQYTCGITLID